MMKSGWMKLKFSLLVSALAVVNALPQNSQNAPSVESHKKPVKVSYLPYYGGAKGQTLQITELEDGEILMEIIKTPETATTTTESSPEVTTELELPNFSPTIVTADFHSSIMNIHRSAFNIIKLQEKAKEKGTMSDQEKNEYERNLEKLDASAKNVAHEDSEETYDYDDGLMAWFERKKNNKLQKEENKKKGEKQEGNKKKGEKEEEEAEEGEEEVGGDETVSINLPPNDASVAEAKPVGLAVAGVGGVAASKPIATAVVGPGGLAVARPVGTAIAGVAPDQALVPIYADTGVRPSVSKKNESSSQYLNKLIMKYHH